MPDAQRLSFIVPGSLETPTGGYRYDRRIVGELRARGWTVDVLTLGESFPLPDPATLAAAYRAIAHLPPGPVMVDGLALGAMPDIALHLPKGAALIAIVHHPLALESGLSPEIASQLRTGETRALAAARHVVVSGAAVAPRLAVDYGVPAENITLAPPGVDSVPLAIGSGGDAVQLLAVGSLIPRKGYDLLVQVLSALQALPWHLTIIGDDRDAATVRALRQLIRSYRMDERITLTGAVSSEELTRHYLTSDLFVSASRYEGYGMVFTEALAHGLPIVATDVGEVANVLPPGAGILTPPNDVTALRAALGNLLADPKTLLACTTAARAARERLPTWDSTILSVLHALNVVAADKKP